MLSALGFIGSGSRVIVPSIINLSVSSAASTLSSAGLSIGSSTGSTTSGATSGNNGNIASQSVSPGSDAERGTVINYTTYSYSPPPSFPPSWTDNTLAGFTAGSSYSDGVTATNMNYSGSYSVTSGSLPSGISLNSSTGAVTGTPSTGGQSYSFTITASNSYGSTSASFSGTVASAGLVSLGVYFDTVTSQTSLSGSVFADNQTGASYSVSLSSSAGSISPSSFVLNGYLTIQPTFTVTGLSASQTVTVFASTSGASASNSATTLANSQNCTPVLTNEYDTFVGASSTQCNYQNTKVYTNPCTNEVTYVNTNYQIARPCPSCTCPAV